MPEENDPVEENEFEDMPEAPERPLLPPRNLEHFVRENPHYGATTNGAA